MRLTPGSSTTATGFLGNDKGDTFVEGTSIEGHLASIRASRDTDAARINLRHLRTQLLQAVNQSADTPSPLAISTILNEVRIEAVEVVLTTVVVLAPLFVVVDLCRAKRHRGNRTIVEQGAWQGYHVRANHQSVRGTTRLRIADDGA